MPTLTLVVSPKGNLEVKQGECPGIADGMHIDKVVPLLQAHGFNYQKHEIYGRETYERLASEAGVDIEFEPDTESQVRSVLDLSGALLELTLSTESRDHSWLLAFADCHYGVFLFFGTGTPLAGPAYPTTVQEWYDLLLEDHFHVVTGDLPNHLINGQLHFAPVGVRPY